jgi:hypothetical protein
VSQLTKTHAQSTSRWKACPKPTVNGNHRSSNERCLVTCKKQPDRTGPENSLLPAPHRYSRGQMQFANSFFSVVIAIALVMAMIAPLVVSRRLNKASVYGGHIEGVSFYFPKFGQKILGTENQGRRRPPGSIPRTLCSRSSCLPQWPHC